MHIVIFCHSLLSDWNHGNAHFLRGIVKELQQRSHRVDVYEPQDAWSRLNLVAEHGQAPIWEFQQRYPTLKSIIYDDTLDLDAALDQVDLVLVHEWNDPQLVARIGRHRRRHAHYRLLFHDTHHRAVTAPAEMARFELRDYDGVLAFGEPIRDLYLRRGWAERAWTWHEAADSAIFKPLPRPEVQGDVVWIGNWGDGERSETLRRFLFRPAAALELAMRVHGVRYPEAARQELAAAGIDYAGWLPNYRVPEVFAQYRVTVHVPRRPYLTHLPGIPTIRPFEALACGIPLICARWDDEELFRPGVDYVVVRSEAEMTTQLRALLADDAWRAELAANGRSRVLASHTCAHRVDELMDILQTLGLEHATSATPAARAPSPAKVQP